MGIFTASGEIHNPYTTSQPVFDRIEGIMAVSGAVLFLYLAGYQGQIQTNIAGHHLGPVAAAGYDGNLHFPVFTYLAHQYGTGSIPHLCVVWIDPLEPVQQFRISRRRKHDTTCIHHQ